MTLADQRDREEIKAERDRNVVVDAGAGTGKTKTIVDRFVNLLSPPAGQAAIPIERLVAITFTRRAAGELRYRIREAILDRIGSASPTAHQRQLLQGALSGLDAAFIGTIHSFADRLLRFRPREASLSPGYRIEEDPTALVEQAIERFLLAVDRRSLAAATGLPADAALEAEETVRDFFVAGYSARGFGESYMRVKALDDLLADLIATRDVPVKFPPPAPPDLRSLSDIARLAAARIRTLPLTPGGRSRLHALAPFFDCVAKAASPPDMLGAVRLLEETMPAKSDAKGLRRGADFDGDDEGWDLFLFLHDDALPAVSVPMMDWMGVRLARLSPAILALYEAVKSEDESVDQTDLLISLRKVVRQPAHRQFYASLFDHVFVDEFQDTDPVQAEILREIIADPNTVQPRPGAITIVGDPKQSIYRFRRADIAAYANFRDWLATGGALLRRLNSNFRSVQPLIEYVNARFSELMGTAASGQVFEPDTGVVHYEPIASVTPAPGPSVHIVPFAGPKGEKPGAEDARRLEAEALARYLVHLRAAGVTVGQGEAKRPARWGDIAVLASKTSGWPDYFREFDAFGIPWAARGGSVFAKDRLVCSFILALRFIADPEDGVAEAAWFRPPFWPLALQDVASETAAWTVAKELHKTLRRERLSVPPAETARRLLTGSRCAAFVEGGPNGARSLSKLEELILQVDVLSREGLDFDAVTARLRSWLDAPSDYDAPEPVAEDAVRFLTVHQAKGLEFPIVVYANVISTDQGGGSAWLISADGSSAAIKLNLFEASIPPGCKVREREKDFDSAEGLRVAYVAATRARDLLILSGPQVAEKPGKKPSKKAGLASLLRSPDPLVHCVEAWQADKIPDWAAPIVPVAPFRASEAVARDLGTWSAGLSRAAVPVASPIGVTAAIRDGIETGASPAEVLRARKGEGRFGRLFGSTVHRSLQMILSGATGTVREFVARCAAAEGLRDHFEDATADVERALKTLAGIAGQRYPEFPIASSQLGGRLLLGYADVLCVSESEVLVIDFVHLAAPLAVRPG